MCTASIIHTGGTATTDAAYRISSTMWRHKLVHCTRAGYIPCYRPAPWRSAPAAPPSFARGTQSSLGCIAHRPASSTLCQPYIVRTHGICKVGLLRRSRGYLCIHIPGACAAAVSSCRHAWMNVPHCIAGSCAHCRCSGRISGQQHLAAVLHHVLWLVCLRSLLLFLHRLPLLNKMELMVSWLALHLNWPIITTLCFSEQTSP